MSVSVRRLSGLALAILVLLPVAWGARWWWRATHPLIPKDTPPGWVPAIVVAAGQRGELDEPFGVAAGPDGTIYVADAGEAPAIRRVAPDGRLELVAGGRRGFADGVRESAAFDTPSHLAVDADGNVYVADTGNHAIRRVTPDGIVTTVAGDGIAGGGEGPGARLYAPVGVAVGVNGRVFVADTYNDRIVEVEGSSGSSGSLGSSGASGPPGALTTVAGCGGPGRVDGVRRGACFDTPAGLAAMPDGSVVVADTGNDVLRRVAPGGAVETLSAVDWSGGTALLWRPLGVAPASGGRLYVTDSRARIVAVVPDGSRRVLAGGEPGFDEGVGTAARFRDPAGIAVLPSGRVVLADSGNGVVRVLDLPQRLDGWPPLPPSRRPGFDLTRFARVPLVWPIEPQDGPHEIAGTLGEPRGNPGGDGRERFHAGVDIRADDGTLVRAVRDASVTSVVPSGSTGTLSEYVSVGPLTYVHIRVGRDRSDRPIAAWAAVLRDPETGRASRVRVARGTRVAAGEVIGTVNRFRHVHLNVGPSGEEGNALLVGLPGLVDTVPPVIAPQGITLTDLAGRPLTEVVRRRVLVTGPVRIIAEAYDRMDDSPARRRLGLHRVGYQVLRPDGTPTPQFPLPHVAIEFDRLPPAADAPPSLYAPGSGIPFYGTRVARYRYLVTTRVDRGAVVEAPWVPLVPPGDYVIRILAEDAAGNVATSGRDLPITVGLR